MATTLNAGTATGGAAISADTTGVLALQSGSTPTTAVTIDTAQNVGIGTTSPQAYSGYTVLTIDNATNGGVLALKKNSTLFGTLSSGTNAFAIDASGASNNLTFQTNGTERMRLDSSGNLLLNTTSTTGTACMHIPATASKYSISFRSSATTGSACAFYNSGGSGVGEILIGASSTTYSTSSDYRLKENIAPMIGALDKISALKPVTYDWKAGGSSQGFIAHELAEVCPDAVVGTKDAVETVDDVDAEGKVIGTKEVPKYQGIDTSFLVATLTAAIQELNAKVDAQAAEIKALKGVA